MRRSSFVRKGAVAAGDPGTRAGLHGQTLISSGHAELDKILGGGLPLGSLLLLLEDGSSRHHATLLRYFLAEGAACGQATLLAAAADPPGGLAQFIPQQLKRGDAVKEQEPEGEGEDAGQYTLHIAWQYRRYLKPAGSSVRTAARHASASLASSPPQGQGMGSSLADAGGGEGGGGRKVRIAASATGAYSGRLKDWCHEFDLARGLGEEALAKSRAAFLDCRGQQPTANLVSGVADFVGSLDQPPVASSFAGAGTACGSCSGEQPGGPNPSSTVPPVQHTGHTQQAQSPQEAQLSPPSSAQHPVVGERSRNSSGLPPILCPRTTLPPLAPAPIQASRQVGRLAVLSLGSPDWWACDPSGQEGGPAGAVPAPLFLQPGAAPVGEAGSGSEVLRALLRLKAAVRERRCAAVVSVPAALHSAASMARMVHLADAVLALESVADDSDIMRLAPDSASMAGLLHVRKLPSLGTMVPPVPDVTLFLIRNKRRRLSITPVEIDPDAEASMAEGSGGPGAGAGSSAAGLLCSGPPRGSDSALDF